MVEESTTEESKATAPFDFTNLAGGFDPSKMMDQFTKVLGDYNVPGVDVKAVLKSSRKNVEALANANKQAIEGMQAVLTREGEILRQTMEDAIPALKELSAAGSPADAAAKQGEVLGSALEKALANMRELAEMTANFNLEAFDIIRNRVSEGVDEINEMMAKLKKRSTTTQDRESGFFVTQVSQRPATNRKCHEAVNRRLEQVDWSGAGYD
jgi:phasin family protein